MRVSLRRIDVEKGMARFYNVMVVPTLFGEWEAMREWGRIGTAGTVRGMILSTLHEAEAVGTKAVKSKVRRGYQDTKEIRG